MTWKPHILPSAPLKTLTSTIFAFLFFTTLLITPTTCTVGTEANPIILTDNAPGRKAFSCSTSQKNLCYISYTPTQSFHGFVEVRFQYLDPVAASSSLTTLFCFKNSSTCDFIGSETFIYNLSLEGDFSYGSTVYFSIQSSSSTPTTIATSILINDTTSKCLNDNCGDSTNNGTCKMYQSTRQCDCSSEYAGRGCEIPATKFWSNSEIQLQVQPFSQKVISFSLNEISYTYAFQTKQLNLIVRGQSNSKCEVKVVFADSQLDDSFTFPIKETSLNLNDIFYGDSSDVSKKITPLSSNRYFNLIVIINNRYSSVQTAGFELRTTEKQTEDSSQTAYVIFIVVGFVCLFLLIVILGCVHYVLKKKSKNSSNENTPTLEPLQNQNYAFGQTGTMIEMPRANFLERKTERARETEKEFQKLLNEKVPIKYMKSSLLEKLKKESGENPSVSSQNGMKQKSRDIEKTTNNNDEDQQHNGVCSICIMEISAGDSYRKTMCDHYFHTECLDAWMKKQRSCPMCRMSHEIADLQAFNPAKQLELYQIKGKPVKFEMFVNPVSSRDSPMQSEEISSQRSNLKSNFHQQTSVDSLNSFTSPKNLNSSPIRNLTFTRSMTIQSKSQANGTKAIESNSINFTNSMRIEPNNNFNRSASISMNNNNFNGLNHIFAGMNDGGNDDMHSSVILDNPSPRKQGKLSVIEEEHMKSSVLMNFKKSPLVMGEKQFKASIDTFDQSQLTRASDLQSNQFKSSLYNQQTLNFMKSRLLSPINSNNAIRSNNNIPNSNSQNTNNYRFGLQ